MILMTLTIMISRLSWVLVVIYIWNHYYHYYYYCYYYFYYLLSYNWTLPNSFAVFIILEKISIRKTLAILLATLKTLNLRYQDFLNKSFGYVFYFLKKFCMQARKNYRQLLSLKKVSVVPFSIPSSTSLKIIFQQLDESYEIRRNKCY